MKIEFKFRHAPHSEELKTYVSERIVKLEKFELKPVRIEFTFSLEKTTKRVDVHVRGQDIEMHAHHVAEDFLSGVDHVLEKISRQLARKKDKLQAHKGTRAKAPKVS